jgi:hypothetical protein
MLGALKSMVQQQREMQSLHLMKRQADSFDRYAAVLVVFIGVNN